MGTWQLVSWDPFARLKRSFLPSNVPSFLPPCTTDLPMYTLAQRYTGRIHACQQLFQRSLRPTPSTGARWRIACNSAPVEYCPARLSPTCTELATITHTSQSGGGMPVQSKGLIAPVYLKGLPANKQSSRGLLAAHGKPCQPAACQLAPGYCSMIHRLPIRSRWHPAD